MRFRSNGSQELQSVRDRHAHVEDDGVRPGAVGELEAGFGRQGSNDAKALELEHSSESVGYGSIVVYYQDGPCRFVGDAFGRGNHCIILMAKDMAVKVESRPCPVSLYNSRADTLELPVLFPQPSDILSRVEVT
jgi:hypothetical protein